MTGNNPTKPCRKGKAINFTFTKYHGFDKKSTEPTPVPCFFGSLPKFI